MVLRLASGSLAALCFFACSFPDYEFPDPTEVVVETCVDGLQNGEEEGVDCGGVCPDSCDPCSNGRLDEEEEGVDCGGACRAKCPTCDDGLKNGSEAAIDCGGACADRCEVDQPCREDLDCASLHCDLVCQPPSCSDGILNGDESAEDCGGNCPRCDNGESCREPSDCQSSRCQNEICVSAECTDATENDQETDVDCGGDECAPCEPGKKCETSEDCTSLVCDDGVCAAVSCEDDVLNGDESDVDCGGDECAPCEVGQHCDDELDCGENRLCQNTLCVPQNPRGQPLTDRSKWEFSADPGGSNPDRAIDGSEATRWTADTNQANGMYAVLDLGQTEIFFTIELQLPQQYQGDMPASVNVYVSNDGTFPDEPVVSGAPGGQTRTWIPLGSAQVARYIKIEVASAKSGVWWSIGEVAVYD